MHFHDHDNPRHDYQNDYDRKVFCFQGGITTYSDIYQETLYSTRDQLDEGDYMGKYIFKPRNFHYQHRFVSMATFAMWCMATNSLIYKITKILRAF